MRAFAAAGAVMALLVLATAPSLPPQDGDRDGDGVPDSKDLCPDQWGLATNRERPGCPSPEIFAMLPLEKAIKSGSGMRKLAVFTEPGCRFCQALHQELRQLQGAEIYVFLFPLPNHPGSSTIAKAIWCSADRVKALDDAMQGKEIAAPACKASAVDDGIEIGKKLGVTGVPTLILDYGDRVVGFRRASDIQKLLGTWEQTQ